MTARAATWDYTQGADLTIDAVTLENAVAVELVRAALVPSPTATDGSGSIIGLGIGFPPVSASESTQRWDQRVDATGALLAPQKDGRTLYVVMRRTDSHGTADAVIVDYHDASGVKYQVTVNTSYRLVPIGDECLK